MLQSFHLAVVEMHLHKVCFKGQLSFSCFCRSVVDALHTNEDNWGRTELCNQRSKENKMHSSCFFPRSFLTCYSFTLYMQRVFPGVVGVVLLLNQAIQSDESCGPAGFSVPPVSVATARWTEVLGAFNRILDVLDHFQIFSLRPVLWPFVRDDASRLRFQPT